jgi:hypothetical protein
MVGYVARVGQMTNACKSLVDKPESKPLVRHVSRRKNIIIVYLNEVLHGGVE